MHFRKYEFAKKCPKLSSLQKWSEAPFNIAKGPLNMICYFVKLWPSHYFTVTPQMQINDKHLVAKSGNLIISSLAAVLYLLYLLYLLYGISQCQNKLSTSDWHKSKNCKVTIKLFCRRSWKLGFVCKRHQGADSYVRDSGRYSNLRDSELIVMCVICLWHLFSALLIQLSVLW